MKNLKRIIILFILSAVMLTGCQSTPDSVKNKANKYTKSENVDEDKISYVTLDHLMDNKEKVLSAKYQNLELKKSITVEKPESVSVLKLQLYDNFATKEKARDMARTFFDSHKYDKKIYNISDRKWADGEKLYGYPRQESDNPEDYITVGGCGKYYVICKNQWVFIDNLSRIYHPEWENKMGSIKLNGKKVSVDESVDYVNNWCNSKWRKFEKDYNYNVKTKRLSATQSV